MKILLVEDDPTVARSMEKLLTRVGHAVDLCGDAESALLLVKTFSYDAILLDVILPGRSGLDMLAELRADGVRTPVVALSGLGELDDIVRGLDAGADDYLTKPIQLAELMARLRAIQRRDSAERADVLRNGPFEVDRLRHVATGNGQTIDFTAKEFKLFEYFMSHPDEIVRRKTLVDKVWNSQGDPHSNVVDVHVGKVRRKLARISDAVTIETIRGVGFRLQTTGEGSPGR